MANAEHCQQQLAARGVNVPLTDVGDVVHNTSAVRSVPQVLDWFDSLR
jgi:hypothetical protein